MSFGDAKHLSDEETAHIRGVVARYGHLSGEELSSLTHRDLPWRIAREGLRPDEHGDVTIEDCHLIDTYRRFRPDADAPSTTPSAQSVSKASRSMLPQATS